MACQRCGGPVGWLGSVSGEAYCGPCTQARTQALATWTAHLESYLTDQVLTPAEEATLRQLQLQLGLTDADVQPYLPRLLRAKALGPLLSGQLPVVAAQGLLLSPGERCHFACSALLLEEASASASMRQNQAQGVWSGPLRRANGVSLQTAGRPLVQIGQGSLYLTSQRLVFLGPRTLEVPHHKLLGIEPATNGLWLSYQGQKKGQALQGFDGEMAAIILQVAARQAPPPNQVPSRRGR